MIPVVCVSIFFFVFVLCGSLIYKDYGISLDEQIDYIRGQINYERFSGGSLADFQKACQYNHTICYYPPSFSMLLYWYAHSGDSQAIYWARHQLTFDFFAFSVFIFFLVGKKIFKDWRLGLLGALFLIVSPRIFAHSFYNPKDIPCLSAYIIAIYTMLLLLEKKNVFTAPFTAKRAAASMPCRRMPIRFGPRTPPSWNMQKGGTSWFNPEPPPIMASTPMRQN